MPITHSQTNYDGTKIGQHTINALLYADDVALIASDHQHLQELLTVCDDFATRHRFAWAPTKSTVVANSPIRVSLSGARLPQKPAFEYLGVTVGIRGIDGKQHATGRACKARAATGLLHTAGFNARGFAPDTNRQVFKQFILPVLDYGVQLLNITALRPLQSAQHFALTTAAGVHRSTSAEALRALYDIESVDSRREVLKTRWKAKVMALSPHAFIAAAALRASLAKKTGAASCFRTHPKEASISTAAGIQPNSASLITPAQVETVRKAAKQHTQENIRKAATNPTIARVIPPDGAKALRSDVGRLADTAARAELLRWILGRLHPDKPPACSICVEENRLPPALTIQHLQACLSTPVDQWLQQRRIHDAIRGLNRLLTKIGRLASWSTDLRPP